MSPATYRSSPELFRMPALVTVFALGLMAAPAVIAAPAATEKAIIAKRIGRQPAVPYAMLTRLIVPPQAVWETDPDAGPLTLRVETGVLGVMLAGGSARIEHHANPLMDELIVDQMSPLPPGRTVLLKPGDRLVIVRGFQLTVTNAEDAPASAIVSRLRRVPDRR